MSQISQTLINEAHLLKSSLQNIPMLWDGKASILEMKDCDYHWRQLEWIGFYGQLLLKQNIFHEFKIPGDRYGNVEFDFKKTINWDLKVHPNNQKQAILNDCVATNESINQYGAHGLLVFCVDCEFDSTGEFKIWHDNLKGGKSNYEIARVERGAKSRIRKTTARVTKIKTLFLNNDNILQLGGAQDGWRNSNGTPRRIKYSITHEQIESFSIN